MEEREINDALNGLMEACTISNKLGVTIVHVMSTLVDLRDTAKSYEAEMCEAHDERDEIRREFHNEVARLKTENELLRQYQKDEVWRWQGDGEDHLESLTCPVLISAAKMRELMYWYKRFEQDSDALDAINSCIGYPCLEAVGDETIAGALARHIINRYIKTDPTWQEIEKNTRQGKVE